MQLGIGITTMVAAIMLGSLCQVRAQSSNAVAIAHPAVMVVHCHGYDVLLPARGCMPVQMHEPLRENPAPAREEVMAGDDETKAWIPQDLRAGETAFTATPVSPSALRRPSEARDDRNLLTATLPLVEQDTPVGRDPTAADRGLDSGWLAHDVRILERADENEQRRADMQEETARLWRDTPGSRSTADATEFRWGALDVDGAAAYSRRPLPATPGRADADWLAGPQAKSPPSQSKWGEAAAP